MSTILFFDDQRLNRRDNVVRRIGRPRLIPQSVYRDPHTNTAWGFPSVFRLEPAGRWRMTYQGWLPDGTRVPLLAESDDGLAWTPRDTTDALDLPDRVLPHQLLPLERFGEWPACFVDERADPAERLKGLVVYHRSKLHGSTRLCVSPDGLHWTFREGVQWQQKGPDPGVHAFWNDVRGSYVITTRPDWTDRRIAVFETTDWQHFTQPELALQADALDAPLTEPYGMPVVPYEGCYIGLLWLFHTPPQIEGRSPHKFFDGRVDCQLAYSLNGWHFQRTLRDPFIPNGDPGEPDAGCVYPSCAVPQGDGSLRIYASACTHEHGHIPPGSGSIVAYELRRDGFVYLESAGGPGIVGTRALHWRGSELELNVQSPGGRARAQVTDPSGTPLSGYTFADCEPFSGDDTAWLPRWNSGKTLGERGNSTLRLEVELTNARLFAIRGDFVPLIAAECWRFDQEGLVPELRKGF